MQSSFWALWALALALPPEAVYRDGFETPRVAWVAGTHDAPVTVRAHDRTDERAYAGLRCERIWLTMGRGTQVLYRYRRLPPVAVDDEGYVRLWIKSNRSGMQLLVRVILPHEPPGPPGQSARVVIVPGPVYDRPGRWQMLEIHPTSKALDRQLRLLRAELKRDVNAAGAYIDRLILNLYGGPGQVDVYIDELEAGPVRGERLEEAPVGLVRPPAEEVEAWEVAAEQIRFKGVPRLPKLAFVRSEHAAKLPTLGVDGVLLAGSYEQSVQQWPVEGPWLVPVLDLPEPGPDPVVEASVRAKLEPLVGLSRLVAWAVPGVAPPWESPHGVRPETRQERMAQLRSVVEVIHARDPRRPVLVVGNAEVLRASRMAEAIAVGTNPIGSSFPLGLYAEWLESRRLVARPGTPLLGWVPTRPAPFWVDAAATYEQIRLAAYAALAAGCRGLVYDLAGLSSDEQLQWVARRVELVNAEIGLIEPFIAAAGPPEKLKASLIEVHGAGERELEAERRRLRSAVESGRAVPRPKLELGHEFDTAVYRTPRAVLVLVAWPGPDAQLVPGQLACRRLTFVVEGVPETALAWKLGPAGAIPLQRRRVAGGMEVTVEEFDTACAVVLSTDPEVLQLSRSRAASVRSTAAARIVEIARQRWERSRRLFDALAGQVPSDALALLSRASHELMLAERQLQGGQHGLAYTSAERALRAVRLAERTAWERWRRSQRAAASYPFLASFTLLPRHVELLQAVQRTAGPATASNLMPEGAFEAADELRRAGWSQTADLPKGLAARAYLAQPEPRRSRALRMVVEPSQESQVIVFDGHGGFCLYSRELQADQAGLFVISCFVKVPQRLKPGLAAFEVYDSLYGETCSVRIPGPTDGWTKVVLYRPVGRGGRMKVVFRLSGAGEAFVDDLVVNFLPLRAEAVAAAPSQDAAR